MTQPSEVPATTQACCLAFLQSWRVWKPLCHRQRVTKPFRVLQSHSIRQCVVAWPLMTGGATGQTARNEKMRIRSNVNLGALLEAQGGYHAAFDAAFSVSIPTHSLFFLVMLAAFLATSCAQPRSSTCSRLAFILSQSAHACIQGCMHEHACNTAKCITLHL